MQRTRGMRAGVIALPLPTPLRSGIHSITSIYNVIVDLDDDGLEGVGVAFQFSEREAIATKVLVEDLFEIIDGLDWRDVVGARRAMWKAINHAGQSGPPLTALAAVDTALWDLCAKRAGLPLFRLWGGGAPRIPAYASGGWLSYSIDELIAEAAHFRDLGFRAYKMKVGSPDHDSDVDRVRRVQQALGSDLTIMVDANQAYTRSNALRVGRRLEELGVDWFEEPVHALDYEGAAHVADALDMRVASGETVFALTGMHDIVKNRAADVVMPDLGRVGGLTAMRQAVALFEAHNLEISPHVYPEVSAHVLSASDSSGGLVEYLPLWWKDFLSEAPELVDGHLVLSERPGLGIAINPELPRT